MDLRHVSAGHGPQGDQQLATVKEIGVTQKSAWFMLHRLREACGSDLDKLRGIVEVDETYIGGVEKNKHKGNELRAGRGTVGKTAVLWMRERGGRTVALPNETTDMASIHRAIFKHIEVNSELHTDDAAVYGSLGGLFFGHQAVNHSRGEFVRDGVTTNGTESVFAILKRGVLGVHHHVTVKHLGRYVDEFAFRLNQGNVRRHTTARLGSFLLGAAGKRLAYKALTQ